MQKLAPNWALFQWIVGGLLFVIAVLTGVIYNDMRGSITEAAEALSTFKVDVTRQLGAIKTEAAEGLSTLKIDVARQLGEIKAEISVTNAKLDQVVDRLNRMRIR